MRKCRQFINSRHPRKGGIKKNPDGVQLFTELPVRPNYSHILLNGKSKQFSFCFNTQCSHRECLKQQFILMNNLIMRVLVSLVAGQRSVNMFAYLTAAFSYLDGLLAQYQLMHAPPHPAHGARMDQYKTKWNNVRCEAGRSNMIVFNHQVVVQEWVSDPDSSPGV